MILVHVVPRSHHGTTLHQLQHANHLIMVDAAGMGIDSTQKMNAREVAENTEDKVTHVHIVKLIFIESKKLKSRKLVKV